MIIIIGNKQLRLNKARATVCKKHSSRKVVAVNECTKFTFLVYLAFREGIVFLKGGDKIESN